MFKYHSNLCIRRFYKFQSTKTQQIIMACKLIARGVRSGRLKSFADVNMIE